jgi:hypothetical protein
MKMQVRKKLKHNCSAVQFPIGLEDQIKGLVDLVHNQAYYFQGVHGYVLGKVHHIFVAGSCSNICCVSHFYLYYCLWYIGLSSG